MAYLNPYLHFGGNCREAMEFYQACLGGDLTVQTIGDSPMAANMPPEMQKSVLHSELRLADFTILASDMMEPGANIMQTRCSLCLIFTSMSEIRRVYAALTAGGTSTHPLKEEYFGTFGDCTDKFGIEWMFQSGPNTPE